MFEIQKINRNDILGEENLIFNSSKMKTKSSKLMEKLSKLHAPEVLKDFCESTTLHGYNYFFIADSILSKMVWAIIILVTTGIGIKFLVINTKAYNHHYKH